MDKIDFLNLLFLAEGALAINKRELATLAARLDAEGLAIGARAVNPAATSGDTPASPMPVSRS